MDRIPLEMHMGLEMKGELPDKMHCTSLSTKFWIMGWVLGQILKATGWSCGYFHKPCGSWGSLALTVVLHVKAVAPVPSAPHAHGCAVIREINFGRMEGMGCRGSVLLDFILCVSFLFLLFFSIFFSFLFPSFISSLFCYLVCLHSHAF